MPIPGIARKGLSNIRTNASCSGNLTPKHMVYLKIGTLEMEKERRLVELRSAKIRIQQIELRCKHIDNEVKFLLSQVHPSNKARVIPLRQTIAAGAAGAALDSRNSAQSESTGTAPVTLDSEVCEEKTEENLSKGVSDHNATGGFKIRY